MIRRLGFIVRVMGIVCYVLASAVCAQPLDSIRGLMAKGLYQTALARLETLLRADSGNADAHFLHGVVLVRLGRVGEGVEIFKMMTRRFPSLSAPYNNLAVLYASQGDLERARGVLEKATQVNSGDATAYENLGDLYSRMAANAYDRATRLDPGRVEVKGKLRNLIEMLALAYRSSGKDSEIGADMERAPGRDLRHTHTSALRSACVQPWPAPEGALAERMGQWLMARGAVAKPPTGPRLFRVYLPERKSLQEARVLQRALKSKGVKDCYVLSVGASKGVVAFGAYRNREYARERIRELQRLGIESLQMGTILPGGSVFRLKKGGDGTLAAAFGKTFSGHSLTSAQCP